jgi:hypothetical protein
MEKGDHVIVLGSSGDGVVSAVLEKNLTVSGQLPLNLLEGAEESLKKTAAMTQEEGTRGTLTFDRTHFDMHTSCFLPLTYTHSLSLVHTPKYTHGHTHVCTHTHTRICVHVHAFTHPPTHTHTHTHTTSVLSPSRGVCSRLASREFLSSLLDRGGSISCAGQVCTRRRGC